MEISSTSTPIPETRPSTAASTTSSTPTTTTPEPVKPKVEEVKPVVKETPKVEEAPKATLTPAKEKSATENQNTRAK